jgi:hypothetical protein
MPLHSRDAAVLDALSVECRRLFGGRLEALALYGEAATDGYRPLVSPLATVVLLDRVDTADLRVLRRHMDAWHRARLETPLVIDPTYLVTSRDTFPLELLELRDRHRLLHGAHDPFAALPPPDLPHLRLEVEEQLKGKLLHLRTSYLALAASRHGLGELLHAVRSTLDVLLRGMLALAERPRPTEARDVLRAVADLHGVALGALARLDRWSAGEERLGRADLETVFAAVHGELATLVDRIETP